MKTIFMILLFLLFNLIINNVQSADIYYVGCSPNTDLCTKLPNSQISATVSFTWNNTQTTSTIYKKFPCSETIYCIVPTLLKESSTKYSKLLEFFYYNTASGKCEPFGVTLEKHVGYNGTKTDVTCSKIDLITSKKASTNYYVYLNEVKPVTINFQYLLSQITDPTNLGNFGISVAIIVGFYLFIIFAFVAVVVCLTILGKITGLWESFLKKREKKQKELEEKKKQERFGAQKEDKKNE